LISRADYCWECSHITIQLEEGDSWICQECHKFVSQNSSRIPERNFFNYKNEEGKK